MRQYTKVLLILCILLLLIVPVVSAGTIGEKLTAKSTSEIATIKATEIAKDPAVAAIATDAKVAVSKGEVNIKSINYDEKHNALKVVFTATIDGKERAIVNPVFIHNAPLMIVTGMNEYDDKNPDADLRILEENPKEALLDVLEQVARNAPEGESKFISGDPTLIVYADAYDDCIYARELAGIPWYDISRDAGYSGTNYVSIVNMIGLTAGGSDNNFTHINRAFEAFNTSAIGSGSTIDSAKLSVKGYEKYMGLGGAFDLTFTRAYPPDLPWIYGTAFDKVDNILIMGNISTSAYSDSARNNFTFSNLTSINKTGWTTLAGRSSWDLDRTFGGEWYSGSSASIRFYSADASGTTDDPFLEIVYTEGASTDPPTAAFSANTTSICVGGTVAFTDASTATPTSWLWDFGDGNTSTNQNPTHQYDIAATYDINLTATNTNGSDSEVKSNYITVNESCPEPTPTPTPTATTATPTPTPTSTGSGKVGTAFMGNIVLALNIIGLGLIVAGIVGIIYTFLNISGSGNQGFFGESIVAVLVGALLLIMSYLALGALFGMV